MSDTSRTDDSAPSLSSYPPAFVSLISTFMKRAEEAETRAHKAMVILRSKDQQMVQFKERMEALEKIASRLEDVVVPPLDLPLSPLTSEPSESPHRRDFGIPSSRQESNHLPLETLYERFPTLQGKKEIADHEVVHNCYNRCQHLIDGLERSNCQLREALTAESQQRVKEHERYESTLAAVSQTVKQLQSSQHGAVNTQLQNNQQGHPPVKTGKSEYEVLRALLENSFPTSVVENIGSILGAAGDNKIIPQETKETVKIETLALVNKQELEKTVDMAEALLNTLRKRLEKGTAEKRSKRPKLKASRRVIGLRHKTSRSSTSSYHSSYSAASLKPGLKKRSLNAFFNSLRRKYKKIKLKYAHVYEKFTESLKLCGQLQNEVITLTYEVNRKKVAVAECYVQTDKTVSNPLPKVANNEVAEKPQTARNIYILQGRLEAAAKVMTKQCKQVQELQQQLSASNSLVVSLKKRLSRAESAAVGKDVMEETAKRQVQELEKRNLEMNQEIIQLKNSVNRLKQELSFQTEAANRSEQEKHWSVVQLEEMKRNLEMKLTSLGVTLRQKDELSERATVEMENKLKYLREQFLSQATDARDRLVAADSKIQELYLGIETFLHLLFSLNRSSTPELSPSSQAHAVQMASDILQLEPGQVQNILHSSRLDNYMANKWIKECNRLVYNKVFAKSLGHFLLEAVFEAKLS